MNNAALKIPDEDRTEVPDAIRVRLGRPPGSRTISRKPPSPNLNPERGARIQRARDSLCLTRSRLGEMLGVTHSAVTQWEAGTGVSMDNLSELALILHVSTDWLLFGRGEPPVALQPRDAKEELSPRDIDGLKIVKRLTPSQLSMLRHMIEDRQSAA